MKKILTGLTIIAVLFGVTACSRGLLGNMNNIWEQVIEENRDNRTSNDAEAPVFNQQPIISATYNVGETPPPLSVAAFARDLGTITYQWFRNTTNENSGGDLITGATTMTYVPSTAEAETIYYYAEATNTNNNAPGNKTAVTASSVAEIIVIAKVDAAVPNITKQPAATTTYSKDAAPSPLTVTATASDGGTLTYQWYSNSENSNTGGTSLGDANGARTSSYTPSTAATGTSYYYVEVTNRKSGANPKTATSNVAVVIVNALSNAEAPIINTQPAATSNYSLNVTASPLTVSASVSDGGTLSYRWYSNTANNNTGGSSISGATNTSYTPPTSATGTMYYYVIVTNTNNGVSGTKTASTTSIVAAVVVSSATNALPPNISSQPASSTTYTKDATATALKVTAASQDGGTLSYQWYNPATNTASGGTAVGTNSSSYTPPTNAEGTKYYYVVVTNTNNNATGTKTATATSTVATVIVNALVNAQPPNITGHPASASYNQNATATALSVTAASLDDGSLTYQWYSNSSNSNSGGSPISAATGTTYTPPTGTAGTKYYYVVVTNTNNSLSGTKTATATSNAAAIIVNAIVNAQAPSITVPPAASTSYNQSATASPLTVTASVTDGGTLSYQWYSNNTNSNSGGTSLGVTTASYTPPTTTVGTKYYYVTVTNTNNSVNGTKTASTTSSVATVTVNALVNAAAPTITGQPALSTTYAYGATASALTVTATVSDGGTLSYQWYSNTSNSNSGGTSLGVTTTSYTPPTTTVGTKYYYVIVTNTNNSVNGAKTATTTSNVATIIVNNRNLNITVTAAPSSGAPLSPISTNTSTTFTVQVDGFLNAADAYSTGLSITAVTGLSFSGHTTAGNATSGVKTFTVTVTYNGTQAFSTGSQALSITGLTGIPTGHAYSGGTKTTTVYITDGQDTTFGRLISVSQSNISAFNTYARTTAGLSKNYKLTGNVTLTGTNNWTPIGTISSLFTGYLDGGGYTISGLNISTTVKDAGLFGDLGPGAIIENLGVSGTVSGYLSVGGIAGYNGGGLIQNCYFTGTVTGTSNYIGGIVGYNYYTTNASSSTTDYNGIIRNCYSNANVSGVYQVGGIVGHHETGRTSSMLLTALSQSIRHCYSLGNVTGDIDVGGIAGYLANTTSSVVNSYATGTIAGNNNAGGIVGGNYGGRVYNCVGLNKQITRRSGTATEFGRVVGINSTGTIAGCYGRSNMSIMNTGNYVPTTASSATLTGVHGATITSSEWYSTTWWSTTSNWNGNAPWFIGSYWNNATATKLPTLIDPPGTQNPVVQ